MSTRARVALIRATAPTVLRDYERLLGLAGLRAHLDPAAATLLVAASGRHFPFPAANTPPWQLEGVVRALRDAGYAELELLQRRPTLARPFAALDLNGYAPIARAQGVLVRDAFARGAARRYQPRFPLLALDRMGARAIELPDRFFGNNNIQLATIRPDRALGLAGAVRGVVDGLFDPRRYVPPGRAHELAVDLLAIRREIQAGGLAIIDGSTIDGPASRAPEVKNALLASADPVALDAVVARLIGFDPLRDLPYLRLAHERGLGVADPRLIELEGDLDLAGARWQTGGVRERDGALRRIRQMGGGALIDRTLDAVERYTNYYRWTARDRWVFASWLRGTQWGRLFQQYSKQAQEEGT